MKLSRLQSKIKKTLKNNAFDISDDMSNDNKIMFIVKFNNELNNATFYVNKKKDTDNITIGANIILDNKIFIKTIIDRIKLISNRFNVSCLLSKEDNKEINNIVIQTLYHCAKFKQEEFLFYLYNFQQCMSAIYADIYKYINYQDMRYLDLSMFANVDWAIFDPYKYIYERDKKFDGSWENYIMFLDHMEDMFVDLTHVQICKAFEDTNNVPIDIVCDYVVEQVIQYTNDVKEIN